MKSKNTPRPHIKAFTLPELLVSMTILLVLMLLLTSILGQVQRSWNYSEGRISQFREARIAFDIITKNLSQASLNTYWDYQYDALDQVVGHKRQSELHFVTFNKPPFQSSDGKLVGHSVFFQAPLGFSNEFRNLSTLYNARGYYILFGGDEPFKPSFIDSEEKYRFRLMEYFPPAEENQIFNDGDEERLTGSDPEFDSWWKYDIEKHSHPLAENIITLIVSPRDSVPSDGGESPSQIAPSFDYDSSQTDDRYIHQVPPLVRVTIVAIDETSALILESEYGTSLPSLSISDFTDSGGLESDLDRLKEELEDKRLSFKVFSTVVAIRTSKWSEDSASPNGDSL